MTGYLLVAAGAAVGAPLRYLADRIIQSRRRRRFPLGTITVNVVGSAVLGAVAAAASAGAPTELELLLGTGFCGAFTTYSTFSFETVRLLQEQERRLGVVNALGSMVAGLAAATIGYLVVLAVAG